MLLADNRSLDVLSGIIALVRLAAPAEPEPISSATFAPPEPPDPS
jgi:hypothetical protein